MFSSNTSQVSSDAVFIEDTFSCFLYTGNSSTQTITNGIDLAGKGGLIWTKTRNAASANNIVDTVRGATKLLVTNTTAAQQTVTSSILNSFNANGYTLSSDADLYGMNIGGSTYASWTFRKQPKFFDVVTYTGNGNTGAGQDIPHNLGSVPGCIIIKATSTTGNWLVYHRSTPSAGGAGPGAIYLNTTAARSTTNSAIGGATATSFNVGVNTAITAANTNGVTYVAYLFAHDAGGFGLTGADNVISCGITDGSKVTLGYEPQWILHKASNFSSNWDVLDTMRGMPWGNQAQMLNPNLSSAEALSNDTVNGQPYSPKLYADGFELGTIVGNHIYIAIRRGPMKVPTDATKVYNAQITTGNGSQRSLTGVGFPPDLYLPQARNTNIVSNTYGAFFDRLRGAPLYLRSQLTAAEYTAGTTTLLSFDQSGVTVGTDADGVVNYSGVPYVQRYFRRAPGFFDEVCYTGNGGLNQTINHNLGVLPELAIFKSRTYAYDWPVKYAGTWGTNTAQILDYPNASQTNVNYGATATSTTITLNTGGSQNNEWNRSGAAQVAYLFASCPGVSKCFNFTGTGTLQTINCGFTSGARLVLIKRTDASGDWYIWDSSRGITSGNDPYLLLNSTAAEVTTTNWVDATAVGFQVTAASGNNVNISGASYIGLAIS